MKQLVLAGGLIVCKKLKFVIFGQDALINIIEREKDLSPLVRGIASLPALSSISTPLRWKNIVFIKFHAFIILKHMRPITFCCHLHKSCTALPAGRLPYSNEHHKYIFSL